MLPSAFQLSSLDVFLIGAIAKAVATTVTYPMQTVQSILRVSAGVPPRVGPVASKIHPKIFSAVMQVVCLSVCAHSPLCAVLC